MKPHRQILEVWGDFACFSQPALKVERFTYPVITPSAIRNIFDAIYLKHSKFRWQPLEVELLTPPRFIALRRNEMKQRAPSPDTILRWINKTEEPLPLYADTDKDYENTDQKGRTQRQTIALRDVRYRLHAEIRPWPGFEKEIPAFEAQFRRRAERGQCVWQPYLGMREFPAFFRLITDSERRPQPFPLDLEMGWMLYDVFDLSKPGSSFDKPFITVFDAKVTQGHLQIPPFESEAVRKP